MRKFIFFLPIIIILTGCQANANHNNYQPKPVACTMEAKLCPDGSAVGRSGPNCEFTACPAAKPGKK
jgi:hypothetical protein